MSRRECETYLLWSPSHRTITARCSTCSWSAPPREQTDIAGAENDEIEHLWHDLLKQQAEKASPDA